jgi:hypothetical protein
MGCFVLFLWVYPCLHPTASFDALTAAHRLFEHHVALSYHCLDQEKAPVLLAEVLLAVEAAEEEVAFAQTWQQAHEQFWLLELRSKQRSPSLSHSLDRPF